MENANDAPVIEAIDDVNTGEEQPVNVAVAFTDADDNDAHTIQFVYDESLVSVAGNGQISGSLLP